jgi:hypothetical protein
MQDEQFMRSWNDGHDRLSADIDRGFGLLADRLSHRGRGRKAIRNPYGIPAETGPALPPRAKASLRGLAATVLTATLWLVVLALATPAPGLAASREASVATCACVVLLPLA